MITRDLESKKLVLRANETSRAFYARWKNDSILSISLYAPICLIICLICFTMIVGFSLKLLLVLSLPLLMIWITFIYVPIFKRGKYINGMVEKISVTEQSININTYEWFGYKARSVSSEVNDMQIVHLVDEPFFGRKKVWVLGFIELEDEKFYVVEEFFENSEDFLKFIGKWS